MFKLVTFILLNDYTFLQPESNTPLVFENILTAIILETAHRIFYKKTCTVLMTIAPLPAFPPVCMFTSKTVYIPSWHILLSYRGKVHSDILFFIFHLNLISFIQLQYALLLAHLQSAYSLIWSAFRI